MKFSLRYLLAAAFALALLFVVCVPALQAQTEPTPTVTTPAPEIPSVVTTLLAEHAWLTTALAIFGALSVAYQAVLAWAHKRAAETADLDDDKWLASLEAKPWFKFLDRLFYWGGYLGAKFGGRKL